MLELKLAGLCGLEYQEFWSLFGEGYLENLESILDEKLSPHLSPFAFDFWRRKSGFKNLYKTGCSGLAIRIFQYVIKFKRLQESVKRLCHCETIVQQISIWVCFSFQFQIIDFGWI